MLTLVSPSLITLDFNLAFSMKEALPCGAMIFKFSLFLQTFFFFFFSNIHLNFSYATWTYLPTFL